MHRKSLAILAGPEDGFGLSRAGCAVYRILAAPVSATRARAKWFGVFGHRPNPNPRMTGGVILGCGGHPAYAALRAIG
jgi:hypothetical protein